MQSITVEATIANGRTVMDFIDGLLEESNCPMKAQTQIDVAVDELFGNIANYAYLETGKTGMATVTAGYDADKGQFEITFVDSGTPYNPLEKSDPDVTLSAEERKIGGLGIYLVKKMMDEMQYAYENGQNILTVVKKY